MVQYNDDEKPFTPNAAPAGSRITKGLVTLQPVKYNKDDVSLGEDMVTAEVELSATLSTAVREKLDLVMVLDVGDSMAGARMEMLKKAMRFVLMKLTPVDRLSIVTFSDEVKRLCPLRFMTHVAKDDLKLLIDGLEAGGEPNLLAGLETGLEVISSRRHTTGRTGNIFLVSAGPCTEENIAEAVCNLYVDITDEVAVYTFGLGNSKDASELHRLLAEISVQSLGGTFNWVPDGASLSAALSQPLAGLLTVVAQDVEVTLTPRRDEDPKMEASPGVWGEHDPSRDRATGAITFKFGALFSGESRKVIVNFRLSHSAAEATRYDAELADVQHSYTAQGTVQGPRAPQLVQVRRSPNPTGAGGTGSRARRLRAEQARRQHISVISRSEVDLTLGPSRPRDLDRVRYRLVAAQNALEDIVLDEDGNKGMVGTLRAEIRLLLALVLRKSLEVYQVKGAPYVFATKGSHIKQRFAARGHDIDVIRLYATPRMDTYLQQARQFDKDPDELLPNADEDAKNNEAALRTTMP
ncbi:unnamed protein product [Urochloa decumbens]|uniref:VWFA domain-containing protein n=1 Tax=Urochloa decumbens TaxID=240449 RepID=A0ABC9CM51_9POAL